MDNIHDELDFSDEDGEEEVEEVEDASPKSDSTQHEEIKSFRDEASHNSSTTNHRDRENFGHSSRQIDEMKNGDEDPPMENVSINERKKNVFVKWAFFLSFFFVDINAWV